MTTMMVMVLECKSGGDGDETSPVNPASFSVSRTSPISRSSPSTTTVWPPGRKEERKEGTKEGEEGVKGGRGRRGRSEGRKEEEE